MAVANFSAKMKVGRLAGYMQRHLVRCFLNVILTLPLLLVGSPGIGKTEITQAVRVRVEEELGETVHLMMLHPVTKSDVDFAGHPVVINGQACHLAYGDLQSLIDAKEYTLVLIDDVGQSKPSVQAPIMQVVRERRINGFKISDKVQFVLCTNSEADKSGVAGILRALQNRCAQVTIEADPFATAAWLEENYSDHPEVAAFVKHRPGYLLGEFLDADQKANKIGTGIPTPRSVAMVAEVLRFGHDLEDLPPVMVGLVGMGFTSEFLGWMRVWKSMVKFESIMKDPDAAKMPSGVDGHYAQVGMLCQRTKRTEIDKVAKYVNRMGREFSAYFWNLVEQTRNDLVETATYQEWRMSQKY